MLLLTQIISVFLLSYLSYVEPQIHQSTNNEPGVYRILEIDKTRKCINNTSKAYIILAQDTITKKKYSIVSIKRKCKKATKITIGECYQLSLKNYYDTDQVIQLGLKLSVYIEGVLINIPVNFQTSNIYTSEQLIGIYYKHP